jgi:hypothetical protein
LQPNYNPVGWSTLATWILIIFISGNVEILKKKKGIRFPKKGFFPKKEDLFMGRKEYFRI